MKLVPLLTVISISALSTLALAGCSGGGSSATPTSTGTPTAAADSVCASLDSKLGDTVSGLSLTSGHSTGPIVFTCTWDDPKQTDPLKQKALVVQSAEAAGPVDKSLLTGNAALAGITDAHVASLGGIVYATAGSATLPNRIVSVDTPKTSTTITVRNFGSFDDAAAVKVVDAVVTQ